MISTVGGGTEYLADAAISTRPMRTGTRQATEFPSEGSTELFARPDGCVDWRPLILFAKRFDNGTA